MKKYILLIFLASTLSFTSSIDDTIRDQYLKNYISDEENAEPCSIVDFQSGTIGVSLLAKKDSGSTSLSSAYDERSYLAHIFSRHFKSSRMPINKDWSEHLQVFSKGNKKQPHLYAKLFDTENFVPTEVYGAFLLQTGFTNHLPTILERQDSVKYLMENRQVREGLSSLQNRLGAQSHTILNLFRPNGLFGQPEIQKLQYENLEEQSFGSWPVFSSPYTSFEFIVGNYFQVAVLAGVAANMFMPAPPAIAVPEGQVVSTGPFGILGKLKSIEEGVELAAESVNRNCLPRGRCRGILCRIIKSSVSAVRGLLKFSMVVGSVMLVKTQYNSHNMLQERGMEVSKHLIALGDLLQLIEYINRSELPKRLNLPFTRSEIEKIQLLRENIDYLADDAGSYFFQANYLRAQAALNQFLQLKPILEKYLFYASKALFFNSVATVLVDSPENLVLVDFLASEATPTLHAKGLINPMLESGTAVSNDVDFSAGTLRHALLTGDNAAGKSTLMRGIAINMLNLAQTLGVAASESFQATPFYQFNAYMGLNEVPEGSSEYDLEERRALGLHRSFERLEKGQFAFYVCDEIFSSVSQKDALECSQVVLENLARHPRSMGITSSHIEDLCDIEQQVGPIHNIHMGIVEDGGYRSRTFKLEDGCNIISNYTNEVDADFGFDSACEEEQ